MFFAIDLPPELPPHIEEKIICSVQASSKYSIPVNALLAVADTEGGKPGQQVKNTNGTYDVGTMQFNTAYLKELAHYDITIDDVNASGCYPYELAAWRIKNHLDNDDGDFWQKVANYHSKTAEYNSIYKEKLMTSAAKWENWFNENITTNDVDYSIPPSPYTGVKVNEANTQGLYIMAINGNTRSNTPTIKAAKKQSVPNKQKQDNNFELAKTAGSQINFDLSQLTNQLITDNNN